MKELTSSMPKRNILLLLGAEGVPFDPDMSIQELMNLQMGLVDQPPAQITINEAVEVNKPKPHER